MKFFRLKEQLSPKNRPPRPFWAVQRHKKTRLKRDGLVGWGVFIFNAEADVGRVSLARSICQQFSHRNKPKAVCGILEA